MPAVSVAAVDLGATSGRVMLGQVGPQQLRLEQVARFPNGPVRHPDGLHWDYQAIREHVLDGLRAAGTSARTADGGGSIRSIGIDTWAADYGLLASDAQPVILGEPFHYRDPRTAAGVAAVHAVVPFEELHAQNGLQFQPFNTLYQLAVDREAGRLAGAGAVLLIPDLLVYELTGRAVAEITNASTTGLLSVEPRALGRGSESLPSSAHVGAEGIAVFDERMAVKLDAGIGRGVVEATIEGARGAHDAAVRWNEALIAELGFPRRLFPPLVAPGDTIGRLTPAVRERLGFDAPVVAVGSHDTASAVVATPMTEAGAAFLSCGTWGLVGIELDHPVVTEESQAANFTNERGVDGRTRFLRNVMGLWLLNESMNAWAARGLRLRLPELLHEAALLSGRIPLFDVNDPRFLAPGSRASDPGGDMPARIVGWLREHGEPVPESPAGLARSIIESLAVAFARAIREASELSGEPIRVLHIVGGGSQNELLCRRTAARSGLPVIAGPAEATAIGNVLIQARALGVFASRPGRGVEGSGGDVSLEALRRLVARITHPVRYDPAG